jgi:hypothetical protein
MKLGFRGTMVARVLYSRKRHLAVGCRWMAPGAWASLQPRQAKELLVQAQVAAWAQGKRGMNTADRAGFAAGPRIRAVRDVFFCPNEQ